MHNLMGACHIMRTYKLDAHVTAAGACNPGDSGCVYVELVRRAVPAADRLPPMVTFIMDLTHKRVTNNEGCMFKIKMQQHLDQAENVQAILTLQIQASMASERAGLAANCSTACNSNANKSKYGKKQTRDLMKQHSCNPSSYGIFLFIACQIVQ